MKNKDIEHLIKVVVDCGKLMENLSLEEKRRVALCLAALTGAKNNG